MFFSMRLTDESIKQYMSETSYSTWKPVLAFFAVGIIGFGGAYLFIPYSEAIASVYGWIVGIAMLATVFGVIGRSMERTKRIADSFTNEHLQSTLSYGTYYKLAPNFFESRHHIRYYVKFKDENGKVRKCSIAESDDKRIYHTYKKGDLVVVLKYPRYNGRGYQYKAFDAQSFHNYSSIPFESWVEKDW